MAAMSVGPIRSRNEMTLPPGNGPEAKNVLQNPLERDAPRLVPHVVPLYTSLGGKTGGRGTIINTYA
jgi:hypothetical protein